MGTKILLPSEARNQYVWTEEEVLHITSSKYGLAYIYDYSGQLECYLDLYPGDQTVELNSGIYIIVINGYPCKIEV